RSFQSGMGKAGWPGVCSLRDCRGGCRGRRGAGNHHSYRTQPAIAECRARGFAQTLMPTHPILEYLWIIPLLPLLGSAINGLFGQKWPNKIVNGVALGSTGLSLAVAVEAVREFFQLSSEQVPWIRQYFSWISAGNFRAGFDLQVDQLTVVMLLVVTGVGWLIHIYATGYMAHEGGYYRFFSYLNLFMFFMIILIIAATFVLLYFGWAEVGLCRYLR